MGNTAMVSATIEGRQAKRKYGEGGVYLRGRIWHAVYYCNGRKRQESSKSEDRRVAERLLRQRLAEIRVGQEPQRRVFFEQIVGDLLSEYDAAGAHSLRDAEARIRLHLRPYFGGMQVSRIDRPAILEYKLKRRAEEATDGTVAQELALLRRAMNLAVLNGKLRQPPSFKGLFPKLNNARKGFLDPEQYAILSRSPAGKPSLQAMVSLAYFSGMRKGELLSVCWSQVRLSDAVPHVQLYGEQTKNREGRVIPLVRETVAFLQAEQEKHKKESNCRDRCPHPVFIAGRDFRKSWERACTEAGTPWLLFHDLRRSAVRNMVRAGAPESVAMAISGHKTLSIFSRYNITSERDIAETVDKVAKYHTGRQQIAAPIRAALPPAEGV